MRIAFALISREAGGTEFQTCLLADALRQRGHEVRIYCTNPRMSQPMLRQFAPFLARVTPAPVLRSCTLTLLRTLWTWRRWLQRDCIDVAVGCLAMPHWMLCRSAIGLPVRIVGRRGFSWEQVLSLPGFSTMQRQLHWTRRKTLRKTSVLVCNAAHVCKSAETFEGWPASTIRLIRNGWTEFPMAPDNPRLIYAARQRVEKGHDALTRAKGDLDIAYQFDIPDWHRGGILIHASPAEGCSNSIGMAMAHGWPVVAFDTPGNRELLGDSHPFLIPMETGMAGLLRSAELAQGVHHGLRAAWGRSGMLRARRDFSLTAMVDQWEEVLTCD